MFIWEGASMAQTFTTCCKILFLSLITGGVCAQSTPSQTDSDLAAKRALEGLRRREIPEATLPCTADETKWWSDLRSAGVAVRSTMRGNKETKKFLNLLAEGKEKSYQPPIPDRGATLLHQVHFNRPKSRANETAAAPWRWLSNCARTELSARSRLCRVSAMDWTKKRRKPRAR
jgi:hypothetical protein